MKFIQNSIIFFLFLIFCWISQFLFALGYSASLSFNADTQKLTLWEYPVLINSWLTLSGWRLAINLINPSYPVDVNGYINTSSGFCISWNCISSWNSLLPNGSNTWVTLRWTGTGWSDSNSGDILVNEVTVGKWWFSEYWNTALGFRALISNTAGTENSANGYEALFSNTSWFQNTALGFRALLSNTSWSDNTALWFNSLFYNDTWHWNIAVGAYSLYNNTTGWMNTSLWVDALSANTTGNNNTANGYTALWANTAWSNHTAIGYWAAYGIVATGGTQPNVVIGYQALFGGSWTAAVNTAYNNVAIGYQTMYGTTGTPSTGYNNTAVWNGSLNKNTSGRGNSALGYRSLYSNTSGIYNTAIWDSALYLNTVGTYNTAIWRNALYENTTGDYNFALWFDSLALNDVWSYNTAIGSWALWSNTAWSNNVAIGWSALNLNDIGDDNVAIGESSLMNSDIGYSNTAVGTWAWSAINGYSWIVDGSENTFLGHSATAYTWDLSNATAIGANAFVRVSNTMVLGSVNGVNGATSDVQVVMGSWAASSWVYRLDVQKWYINSSSGLCINGDCKSDWSQVWYTSMQLTSNNSSTPANCPSWWTEADYQTTVYSAGNWNRVRTCFIHEEYEIMQLPSDGTPANCPSWWTEVDYKAQSSGFTTNNVRTCIIKW